jgi:hypothetical protein
MSIIRHTPRWDPESIPEYLPPRPPSGPVRFDPTLETAAQIMAGRRPTQAYRTAAPRRAGRRPGATPEARRHAA